jgi:hypothetical protein
MRFASAALRLKLEKPGKMFKIFLVILVFNICDAKCEEPRNNVLFEKAEAENLDPHWISYVNLGMRPVARNIFKVNFTAITERPVTTLWERYVLYYQFTENVWSMFGRMFAEI